jgi:hypothetical protein
MWEGVTGLSDIAVSEKRIHKTLREMMEGQSTLHPKNSTNLVMFSYHQSTF